MYIENLTDSDDDDDAEDASPFDPISHSSYKIYKKHEREDDPMERFEHRPFPCASTRTHIMSFFIFGAAMFFLSSVFLIVFLINRDVTINDTPLSQRVLWNNMLLTMASFNQHMLPANCSLSGGLNTHNADGAMAIQTLSSFPATWSIFDGGLRS